MIRTRWGDYGSTLYEWVGGNASDSPVVGGAVFQYFGGRNTVIEPVNVVGNDWNSEAWVFGYREFVPFCCGVRRPTE